MLKNMHLRANQLIDADIRLTFSEERSESSHLEPKLLGRAVFGQTRGFVFNESIDKDP
jgi:hypothetical protein